MANLFDPVEWADNDSSTALTAARGPSRWEEALESIDGALAFLADQVAALSPAGTGGGTFLQGTTAQRPAPGVGLPYYDLTLGQLIIGNGSSWDDAMGDPVTATPTPAPANLEILVQGDGDHQLDWDAVSGVDTYKLYEDGSPTGVSGATALVVNTFVVTAPSTPRTYNYWVTATIDGLESSISNIVTVVVAPEVTDQTPGQILNIGSGASQNYFNNGIGYAAGHTDKTMAQIAAGFDEVPYFTSVDSDTKVQFQVFMNGGRTSANTSYPRSELRELTQNGTTKAAWDATVGSHIMQGKTIVKHLQPNKPWVTIAQIHDAEDDTLGIKVRNASIGGGPPLYVVASIMGTEHATKLITTYAIDDVIDWKITLINGSLKIYIANVLKITSSAFSSASGAKQYFKAGCYPQSSVAAGGFESSSEYARIWLYDLDVTHS